MTIKSTDEEENEGSPLHNNQRGTTASAKQDYGTPTSLDRLPMDIQLEDTYVAYLKALLEYQQVQAIALQDAFNLFTFLGRNKEKEYLGLETQIYELFQAKCKQREATEEKLRSIRLLKISS